MRADRPAFLFLTLALLLSGCRHGPPEAESDKKPEPEKKAEEHEGAEADDDDAPKHVKVRCEAVRSEPVQDRLELHGTVSPLPDRDAQVSPQAAGRLLKVLVREGDSVTAGQPLAQVDSGPIEDQMHEADALHEKAKAEEENARVTLQRVQKVFAGGIAARQEVDDASARAAAARAAEVQAAAAARRAHRQLEYATVRSPLAGVVLRLLRRTGELVDGTPATPVVEVGDPSALELVADASAQDLIQLARGSAASISFSALPNRSFSGSVAAVSPAVDRTTGLGKVRVTLLLSGGAAPPVGLYGTAKVAVGPARPGLVVPAPALRNRSGTAAEVVLCGADGTAHPRRVQLGVAFDGKAEIRGEIAADDRVAVEPVIGINEGDKLEAAAEKGEKAAAPGGGAAHE